MAVTILSEKVIIICIKFQVYQSSEYIPASICINKLHILSIYILQLFHARDNFGTPTYTIHIPFYFSLSDKNLLKKNNFLFQLEIYVQLWIYQKILYFHPHLQ